MNSQKIIKGKLFLAVLVTMLCGMVAGGCSDDKDELEGKQYGYVIDKIAGNSVEVVVTVSADQASLPEGIKKYL